MPSDDRLGLNNGDGVQHRGEQSIEPHEEQSIGDRQPRLGGHLAPQHVELMPKKYDLGSQLCPRLERRDHYVEDQPQIRDHCGSA